MGGGSEVLIAAFGVGNQRSIDVSTCLTHHAGRFDFESETFITTIGFHGRQDPIHADFLSLPLEAKGGQCVFTDALGRCSVRRLTPLECERLQGFPDGWTDIKYRGKPAKDGPRYKAIGNSMAVPNIRWLGLRILAQEVV